MKTVHVLSIEHRHGTTLTAHTSDTRATKALFQYVREYWDESGPGREGETIPKDQDEAIDAYFHEHPEEFYGVEELEVR
jgi:hypothetical protein